MLSIIVEYISLFMQVAAAAIAISMFKRTKFNSSWILISIGFLLMAISRVFELWPTIYPEMEDQMQIIQRWLAFIISLVLFNGVFISVRFSSLCAGWMYFGEKQKNGCWRL